MNFIAKAGGLFVAALLLSSGGLVVSEKAVAQTAKNVKCKGCVDKKDIGKKAIKSKNIKDGQILSTHIGDNSIAPIDLSAAAKPAGADFSETSNDMDLDPADTDIVVRTVTVAAPAAGVVIATATMSAQHQTTYADFVCSLVQDTALGDFWTRGLSEDVGYVPVSYTRAFPVGAAGDVTVNLVCKENAGSVRLYNPIVVAWFVPGQY